MSQEIMATARTARGGAYIKTEVKVTRGNPLPLKPFDKRWWMSDDDYFIRHEDPFLYEREE